MKETMATVTSITISLGLNFFMGQLYQK